MALYIGIDLGGTNLKYAIGDESGAIKKKMRKPSRANESQKVIFKNIFGAIEELLKEADGKISGIGFGTPGCVDFDEGKLVGGTPNIAAWTDAPIKKTLEDKFHIPVFADNDANLMTLAEARIGASKKYSHVVCLTIGTGIGGGIIIDNKLYRGPHSTAAEIGHITVEFHGKPCNCGNHGCLEVYASAPAMIKRYRHKLKRAGVLYDDTKLSPEFIFQKAALGEDFAIQTIDETSEYLGTGIASVVNIMDPQIVVIGGGVAEAGAEFINKIEKVVRQKIMRVNASRIKIVKAELGNDAGIVGAILLAAENTSTSGR